MSRRRAPPSHSEAPCADQRSRGTSAPPVTPVCWLALEGALSMGSGPSPARVIMRQESGGPVPERGGPTPGYRPTDRSVNVLCS